MDPRQLFANLSTNLANCQCPERLRHVPHQFSWIDQRRVRDDHIARCGPAALALCVLLVTGGRRTGLNVIVNREPHAQGVLAFA
jgi:hypothetical protein